MSKVADIRLFWTPSPSTDIVKRRVVVTTDGEVTTDMEVGLEVVELMVVVNANSSVLFKTILTDSEGKEVVSVEYFFRLGDLIDPLPDTDLGHEIVAIRDEGEV